MNHWGLKKWNLPSTVQEQRVLLNERSKQWNELFNPCPNLNVSFGAFQQRTLMTHRNTSKTRGKTPVELLLGRKVRLPAVTDFDLCERVLSNQRTVPTSFIIRKRMNSSFIQLEKSNKTVLVSDNQIARLEPDDIKTESTDSRSESSRDDIDVASPNSYDETSVIEGEQPSAATRTSSRNKKQPEKFGGTIRANLLKKGGRMWYIEKWRT